MIYCKFQWCVPNHWWLNSFFLWWPFSASQISCRLSDMEEAVREKTRMVSMLQVRTKFLEEENSRLQDRIDSITKQKQGLDKLLKEYKLSSKDVHVSSRDHIFIILKAKLSDKCQMKYLLHRVMCICKNHHDFKITINIWKFYWFHEIIMNSHCSLKFERMSIIFQMRLMICDISLWTQKGTAC